MPGPKATRETRVRLDFGVNPDKREKSESLVPMDPPERFDKNFMVNRAHWDWMGSVIT